MNLALISKYVRFLTITILLIMLTGETIAQPALPLPRFVSLKAKIFPGKSFGRILGFSQMGSGLASAAGPWLAGYIFDVSGTYFYAFTLVLIFKVLSICTVTSCAILAKRKIFFS